MPAATVKAELNLSARTIRRRLEEAGLKARSPRKVPLLTQRHNTNRLKFAKEHMVWPITAYSGIFCGQTKQKLFVSDLKVVENRNQYTVKTV